MSLKAWALCSILVGYTLLPAGADAPGSVEVEVLRADNDQPIVDARVRFQDKNGKQPITEAKTDAKGRVELPSLEEGDYYVEVQHPAYSSDRTLFKVVPGTKNSHKTLLDPAGQERVIKIKESRIVTDNPLDGAVVQRDRDFVQKRIGDTSVQGILQTVPGTQRNSLGQTHVRGDHKSVTFAVDGIALPIASETSTSFPIDPDFFDSYQFRTGNYNASQGGQVGLIFDAQTDWSRRGSFFELRPTVGNLGQGALMAKFGSTNKEGTFQYQVGVKTGASDVFLEPPSPDGQTLNNRGNYTNVMARLKGRVGEDEFGVTAAYQNYAFQLPQTQNNFDAGVRQQQGDTNTLGMLSWKHNIDDDSNLLMSLTYLKTRQTVDNNGVFTQASIFDAGVNEELAEEGLPSDPTRPGAPYLPRTRLEITQIQPAARYTRKLGERHHVVAGLEANFIDSSQRVNIIDAGAGGQLPDGTNTFDANIRRNGFVGGMFFSHTLPLSEDWTMNYGLRLDRFSNGLGFSTGQISPSINFGWTPSKDDAVRLSYNRLFQAPPLELDVSGQTTVYPQRVNLFEVSYERHLGDGVTAKLAYINKQYRDQIDAGLLVPGSNIPLFAPVNFARASYEGWELSVNSRNKVGLNGFLTATLSRARPTQLGEFTSELPQFNDHDQRVQLTGGMSYTWDFGFTAAADFFYGSGYPQEALGLYRAAGLNPYGYSGDRIPRFLTNLNFSYFPPEESDGIQAGASLQIQNLFDDRSMINFLSEFSGTRFVPQRRVLVNGIIRF